MRFTPSGYVDACWAGGKTGEVGEDGEMRKSRVMDGID